MWPRLETALQARAEAMGDAMQDSPLTRVPEWDGRRAVPDLRIGLGDVVCDTALGLGRQRHVSMRFCWGFLIRVALRL